MTPENGGRNDEIYEATKKMSVSDGQIKEIQRFVKLNGTKLLDLAHGAEVFDIDGQNFCLSSCLTHKVEQDQQRQLIYFPDAKLRYSWVYEGAIIF